jgi:hypothetical protein
MSSVSFELTPHKFAIMLLNVQYVLSPIQSIEDIERKRQLGSFLAREIRMDDGFCEKPLSTLKTMISEAIDDGKYH